MEAALFCSACNKSFTGDVPAQQHYMSEKHKKKATAFPGFISGGTIATIGPSGDHVTSSQNAPQGRVISTNQSAGASGGYPMGNGGPGHMITNGAAGENKVLNQQSDDKEFTFNSDTNTGFCNLCNIALSSAQHAQQHLSGKNHAKMKKNASLMRMIPGNGGHSRGDIATETTDQQHANLLRGQAMEAPMEQGYSQGTKEDSMLAVYSANNSTSGEAGTPQNPLEEGSEMRMIGRQSRAIGFQW